VGGLTVARELIRQLPAEDIIYFGDSETGLEIGRRAFETGKKPILELSGNDMLFVWKDCNLEGSLESSLDAFLGSTQICMVPKKIIIHEDIYDEFIEIFQEVGKELREKIKEIAKEKKAI